METIITKSYQGAQTRLLLPKVKDVAGVIGDNNATRLVFKLPKIYATGWDKFVEFDCFVIHDGYEFKPTYALDENNSILIPYEITEANVGKEVDYNLKLVSQDGEIVEKSEMGTLYFRDSTNGEYTEPEPYVDVLTLLYNNAFCNVTYTEDAEAPESGVTVPQLTFTPMNPSGEEEKLVLNVPYLDGEGHILNRFINKEIVVEIYKIATPDELTTLTDAQTPDMALLSKGDSTEPYYMDLYILTGADPTVISNWYLVHTDNPVFKAVTVESLSADEVSTDELSADTLVATSISANNLTITDSDLAEKILVTDSQGKVTTDSTLSLEELHTLDGVRDNIQDQIDSKAPTNHASAGTTYGISTDSVYGHAKASSTPPKMDGEVSVGTETNTFARGDHVHPTDTSRAAQSDLTTERNDRIHADEVLQGSIDTINSKISDGVSSNNKLMGKSYIDEQDATKLNNSQLVTDWSQDPSDDNIPSEKLVKDSLDSEVSRATAAEDELSDSIADEETARDEADAILQGNIDTINSKISENASSTNKLMDKTYIDGQDATKLDVSQLVTSWQSTTTNNNIPSEKLVKDSLDDKLDDSQLVSTFADHVEGDTYIPSAKLVNACVVSLNTAVNTINGKIPAQASSSNQLADKSFVNSSIATNTSYFRGTYPYLKKSSSTDEDGLLDVAWQTTHPDEDNYVTNNDYVFVLDTSVTGVVSYNRYKWVTGEQHVISGVTTSWYYEYTLNNSSFTAAQWNAINSGVTGNKVSEITLNTTARHTHSNKDLLDTYNQTNANISDAVSKKHTHSNMDLLDSYTQSNTDISDAVDKKHDHDNKDVLDSTTASYTTADKSKLDGIEAGAQVNTVTGVKGSAESTYRVGTVNITKANIGLVNVDNTSDKNKPVSDPQKAEFNTKVDKLHSSPAGNGFVKVDVNEQGQVTGHSSLYESDIPTLHISKISGLQSTLDSKQAAITTSNKLSSSLISGLADVATSGSYNDLSNRPTIPTVVSAFTNDMGYLTEHQDISGLATKSELTTGLAGKQDNLPTTINDRYLHTNASTGALEWAQGGVSSFDDLTDPPKYNGVPMTSSTNIPEVKTSVWDAKQDAITSSNKLSWTYIDGLETVAITGSYYDLTIKPTIPTVYNAKLTIQKNGTNVNTFTANASTDVTANITVPTKVSELANDSGYLTTADLTFTEITIEEGD